MILYKTYWNVTKEVGILATLVNYNEYIIHRKGFFTSFWFALSSFLCMSFNANLWLSTKLLTHGFIPSVSNYPCCIYHKVNIVHTLYVSLNKHAFRALTYKYTMTSYTWGTGHCSYSPLVLQPIGPNPISPTTHWSYN